MKEKKKLRHHLSALSILHTDMTQTSKLNPPCQLAPTSHSIFRNLSIFFFLPSSRCIGETVRLFIWVEKNKLFRITYGILNETTNFYSKIITLIPNDLLIISFEFEFWIWGVTLEWILRSYCCISVKPFRFL